MDKSVDRRKNILEETKKIKDADVERIPGVNIVENGIPDKMRGYMSSITRIMSKSAVGCGLSHISTWEKIIENDDDFAIILEDDAIIDDDFNNIFDKARSSLPSDFDILFLGCYVGCDINKEYTYEYSFSKLLNGACVKPVKKINDNLYVPALPLALHGYMVSKSGAKKLVKNFKDYRITNHIDAQMLNYYKSLNTYAVHPDIVKQNYTTEATTNNIVNKYPVVLNRILSCINDGSDTSFGYKMSISTIEILGVPIVNGYSAIFTLLGAILGVKNFLIAYIVFSSIEFIIGSHHENIVEFLKFSLVSFIYSGLGASLSRLWNIV